MISLYKIIFTPHPSLLTKRERIFAVLLYSISIPLISIIWFFLTKQRFFLYLAIVVFSFMFCGTSLTYLFYGKLDDKYNFSGENEIKPSYKYHEWLLISQIPTILVTMLICFTIAIRWSLLILFIVGLIFPILGMYKRMNVFNSIGLKEGIGYNPIIYFLISGLLGFVGYYRFIVAKSIIGIAFIFFIQILLLYPDKMDKILPIDNKTNGGFIVYLLIILVVYAIGNMLILSF